MTVSITDKLKEGIVLGDGGYLLALENRGYVQAGPFTPEVTIENPLALGKMPSEEREWAIDYERPQSATEAYHHMRQ